MGHIYFGILAIALASGLGAQQCGAVESAGTPAVSAVAPLDLTLRREVRVESGFQPSRNSKATGLSTSIARAAVRPCIGPAFDAQNSLRVGTSSEWNYVDPSDRSLLVGLSAAFLGAQFASGGCR